MVLQLRRNGLDGSVEPTHHAVEYVKLYQCPAKDRCDDNQCAGREADGDGIALVGPYLLFFQVSDGAVCLHCLYFDRVQVTLIS